MPDFPRFMTLSFSDDDRSAELLRDNDGGAVVFEKVEWTVAGEDGKSERRGLRYGENPSQPAALYRPLNGHLLLAGAELVHGKERLVSGLDEQSFIRFGKHPSKTNLTDIDAGLAILKHLSEFPAAIIMKHNNPSGVAIGESIVDAYTRAWRADPIAPFGGAIVVNRALTMEAAEQISREYYEVVAAPEFEAGVVEKLAARANLRIVRMPALDKLKDWSRRAFLEFKSLNDGGVVCQHSYAPIIGEPAQPLNSLDDFKRLATLPQDLPVRDMVEGRLKRTGENASIQNAPTPSQWRDMWFAWIVQTGVTSNSVLTAKDGATVSIAVGGQDRVMISKQCVWKAYETRKALIALEKVGMLYDAAAIEAKAGRIDMDAIRHIETEAAKAHPGLEGAVAASDAFFPFRDGPDALLSAGIKAIVQPGGSLRDADTVAACNERGASMVFTHQRCFRH